MMNGIEFGIENGLPGLLLNSLSVTVSDTFTILFLPESTEGVAVGATTAMDYENAADSTENDTETVTK